MALSYIGHFHRARRSARQRLLEPILIGVRAFREVVLNAIAAKDHLIYCRLPHGDFFIDPSDRVIGSWLLWHGRWQLDEIEQAISILKKTGSMQHDSVFVDAGANIGTHTVYAMRSGLFRNAFAFEPETRNYELLRMNIAANDLISKTTIMKTALGSNDAEATMFLHPRNKGAHSLVGLPAPDASEQVRVQVRRLGDILRSNSVAPSQVGLIWIDVEGMELDVIRGLGEYIGRPLVIEFFPSRYHESSLREFRAVLKSHYRSLCCLGSNAVLEPISAIDRKSDTADILVI
jgi:FkbM family methyltransferase